MKRSLLVLGLMLIGVFAKKTQAQLVINEIYASPASGDSEWVEIYNPGTTSVSLVGWQLGEVTKDGPGNFELVDASENLYLPAHGYFTLTPSGKLSLNNGGDTLYLADPTGLIVDEITYPKLTAKQVYARMPDGASSWQVTTSTPSNANSTQAESTDASASAALLREASQSSNLVTGAGKNLANTSSTKANASSAQTAIGKTISTSTSSTTSTTSKTNSSDSASVGKTTTTTAAKTTADAASPTPSPAAKANSDAWKDGIEFVAPRIDYKKSTTPVSATPTPQVLGLSTHVDDATTDRAPPLNWLVTGIAITGIIAGVVIIGLMLGAEFFVTTRKQDENEEDLSVF